ncbi:hypothetical protein K3495_g2381 [Podosphaera aphanis]|nr:hypothetical protein K3495_g2381 [Podosphaera aphanis]
MLFRIVISTLSLIYIFSSNALAASAVLGLDLGTEYIKATIVKPGIPLDIVLTKDSRRKEISAVAFKPASSIKSGEFPERSYGSDAIALAARFPADVYPNLKTLIGLDIDHSIVKEYALRHPALKLVADKIRGTAAFQSAAFVPEEHPWTVEEILAMQLQAIQKNTLALAGKGITVKDVVIIIPPFFTLEEKRALSLAADLAGLRILELISDGMAVGLNYATKRTFPNINEGGKPEINLVFDMGAGSTKASVLKFQGRVVKDIGKFNKTIQEVKLLGNGWDRTLGGDAFNAVIIDDIITQFLASPVAKQKGLTEEIIKGQGRVAAKLWSEAEKMRQVLSANANTQAFFEGIYEDLDFRYKISRAEFEKLTESHAARIAVVMQNSLDAARIKIEDVDSVILFGGASRTPMVHRELEKFIRDASKIKTNVNSDEAAVFGAGFHGAALSPGFRVKEIRIFEIASYTIGMKWINTDGKLQRQSLWQSSTIVGPNKHYTFKNQQDPFSVTFYEQISSPEISSSQAVERDILAISTKNLTESVALAREKHGCTPEKIMIRLSTQIAPESGEVKIAKLIVDCELEAVSDDKESMVDSVKGLFGFGKKEQAPLSDKDASDSTSSLTTPPQSIVASSDTTTSTTSSASTSSTTATASKKVKKAKAKHHSYTIPLSYTTEVKGLPQIPNLEIQRMKERLTAFAGSDKLKRLRDEALNQLESFAYKSRDLLEDAEFIAASTEEERADLKAQAEETGDWIYSGGADANREELRQRLKKMEGITKIVANRRSETASRPEKIAALQKALDDNKQLIASISDQILSHANKHDEFSSKVVAEESAASATYPIASDSASSEGDKSTETATAPAEKQTMEPPVYTSADTDKLQKLNDEYSGWLADKIAEQDKLTAQDNPVLLSKDLEEKTKALQVLRSEMMFKSIKKPIRTQKSSQKPKTSKPGTSTTKASEKSEENASKTMKNPRATFTVGAGGQMPSEEEILELLRKQDDEFEAEKTPDSSENAEKVGDEKHDEL